ncbi:MAG: 6-phosphogluconolactonase [Acidobacteria bacterium]|nr:6-phosphogluconolactonase [Acidobacteriota bacterium]MCI0628100.1 6-phosphogluconolactonase [Acidobacteriota bacterium]MCI0719772.1 6-phosphogluconolactonase [Acidobacteriota bacterium]
MHYGKTAIVICEDEFDLGYKAAAAVANKMRELLGRQEEIRLILAAGESQITFLDALAEQSDIDWGRVVCFNMDDFLDPSIPEELTCGYQVRRQLYYKVRPRNFHLVRFNAPDADEEAHRFERVLRSAGPIDILCQGIGTSGHLAFNEPGQTDFQDTAWVKVVDIAEQSKKQLSLDPNFRALARIPDKGITMTIPAMLSAPHVYTMVPLALKRNILTRLFETPAPTEALPASILSTVESTLFLDRNSCPRQLL